MVNTHVGQHPPVTGRGPGRPAGSAPGERIECRGQGSRVAPAAAAAAPCLSAALVCGGCEEATGKAPPRGYSPTGLFGNCAEEASAEEKVNNDNGPSSNNCCGSHSSKAQRGSVGKRHHEIRLQPEGLAAGEGPGPPETLALTETGNEDLNQAQAGRYLLEDYPTEAITRVTVTELQREDLGLNQCVIHRLFRTPLSHTIRLSRYGAKRTCWRKRVTEHVPCAEPWICQSPCCGTSTAVPAEQGDIPEAKLFTVSFCRLVSSRGHCDHRVLLSC
ncbi:uncharacterized protein LOC109730772 isoform X2 [Microcebus murinus]|uniref:uncharacterized protein LOC109730772 isoform X2 n=1 Tax=Microcebus murinus TaxID=30608 RepID=UPI003F6AAA8B